MSAASSAAGCVAAPSTSPLSRHRGERRLDLPCACAGRWAHAPRQSHLWIAANPTGRAWIVATASAWRWSPHGDVKRRRSSRAPAAIARSAIAVPWPWA